MERWFGIDDVEIRIERYDAAIAVLEQAEGDWLTHAADAGLGEGAVSHFENDWLDGGFWPGLEREVVLEALREGFRDAMIDGRSSGLPYAVVWVAIPDVAADFFGVAHEVTVSAVTVVIATPEPTISMG